MDEAGVVTGLARTLAAAILIAGSAASADGGPSLQLGAFADGTAGLTDARDEHPAFGLGQLLLVLTSDLGASFSALGEAVFETNEQNIAVLDIERLVVRYAYNDKLSVSLGRMHSSIGYYNTAYHHGSHMETTIGRPQVIAFEDEGGRLPVHVTGLALSGEWLAEPIDVGYALEVGNGRGRTPDELLVISDLNRHKSVNAQLYLQLHSPRVRLGGNFLVDTIPGGIAADGSLLPSLAERIIGAHLLFERKGFLLLAEGYLIEHRGEGVAPASYLSGFVEASYGFEVLRPYLRVEGANAPEPASPFFEPSSLLWKGIAGLRWDASEHVAIKAQYERSAHLSGEGAERAVANVNAGAAQVAVAF